MSEKFKEFANALEFEKGVVTYNGTRLIMVSASWLANLQKEIESILGPGGTYVVIRNASYLGGFDIAKKLNEIFKGFLLEDKIKGYLGFATLRGWGEFSLQECSLDPLNIVVKYENSYIKGRYENESEGKCFYFTGIAAIIEEFLKSEGIKYEVEAIETKCLAKGDPYCEFVFRKKE